MNIEALLHNKWTWIGAAVIGAGYLYLRAQATNANASQSDAASAYARQPYYSPMQYTDPYAMYGYGSSGTAATVPTATGTDSLSYLQSLIDMQTAQNQQSYDLATTQAANNLQLGLASINASVQNTNTQANVTNNAEAVSAFQSSLAKLGNNLGLVSGVTSLQNGTLSVDTLGIATRSNSGGKAREQNANLVSGVTNGIASIALPTGGSVMAVGPTANPAAYNIPRNVTVG